MISFLVFLDCQLAACFVFFTPKLERCWTRKAIYTVSKVKRLFYDFHKVKWKVFIRKMVVEEVGTILSNADYATSGQWSCLVKAEVISN